MQQVTTINIGTCVFRNEGDGCLTAKWTNPSKESPFTEGCKLLPDSTQDGFCGTYKTVWVQDGNKAEEATLVIKKHKLNERLYELTWSNTDKTNFAGHGMLFENLLVAAYWEL